MQPDLQTLSTQARTAAAQSYAPYSRFHVGAALLLTNGETVLGCNVENSSYRLTCCAEQTAIAAAVTRFGPQIRIAALAVVNLADVPCQPCGACRQTIAEFAPPEIPIQYPGQNGQPETCTLADLLPAAFNLKTSENS